MARKGSNLERLIASIEKVLAKDNTVTVESPKRIRDKTTGKLREHDVVLTMKQTHHSVQIAIECRDRSRPITINQIEGFWAKCQATNIDQGIVVSSRGFYNTARKKAEHYGIRCLDIEEAASFNWLLASGIHSIEIKLINVDWMFYPEKTGVVDRTSFDIVDVNGNPIERSVLTANARQQLNKLLPHPPEPIEEDKIKVRFEGGGILLRDVNSGDQVPVEFAIATIRYSVIKELIPFRLVQYLDKDTDRNITDAAIAELNLGEHSGKLMIIYKEDAGGEVVYMPDKKK